MAYVSGTQIRLLLAAFRSVKMVGMVWAKAMQEARDAGEEEQ